MNEENKTPSSAEYKSSCTGNMIGQNDNRCNRIIRVRPDRNTYRDGLRNFAKKTVEEILERYIFQVNERHNREIAKWENYISIRQSMENTKENKECIRNISLMITIYDGMADGDIDRGEKAAKRIISEPEKYSAYLKKLLDTLPVEKTDPSDEEAIRYELGGEFYHMAIRPEPPKRMLH